MCDYSLLHARSRPAVKDEVLVVHDFGCGSAGFKSVDDSVWGPGATAVCVLPGTQLKIEGIEADSAWVRYTDLQKSQEYVVEPERKIDYLVAVFSKRTDLGQYHDALEFADGTFVPVSKLKAGGHVRVLQMPAESKLDLEEVAKAIKTLDLENILT